MMEARRKLSMVLSFGFIFTALISPFCGLAADAAATGSPVKGNLNKWLLDEENNNIYIITDNKYLSFFDTKTLALKKEMEFTYISDIDLYNGKLYAALERDGEVAVINTKTSAVEKKIKLKKNPRNMALVDNKIFYVPRYYKGWDGDIVDYSKVYAYNLADSSDIVAMSMTSIPGYENYSENFEVTDLAADTGNGRLFVTARDVYYERSYLFSISSKDYKVLDDGKVWDFGGIHLGMFVNERDIFFGSYRLDKEDLSKHYGNYDGNVAFAKGEYVFSSAGLFDRESFIKVGSFSEYDDDPGHPGAYTAFLADSDNNVYLHGYGESIYKGALSSFIKPDTGDGTPSEPAAIEYNADKMGIDTKAKRMNITKWLVDADKKLIYALSRENNSLMILGLLDMKLKKTLVIGKSPSDLAISGNKLYVALSGINQAAVVNLTTQTIERNILLQHKPNALAVDGSKLFYMGHRPSSSTGDQYFKLYMYDLDKGGEIDVFAKSMTEFLESNLVLDKSKQILYIGHSTHYGALAINTSDYKILASSGYGKENYRSVVSADGGRVVYGYAGLDQNNISHIRGLFREDIVFLKGSYAFSKKAVYDADSFEKLAELPLESESIYMDGGSNVYLFDKNSNTIRRFSLLPLIAGFPQAYAESIRNTDYGTPRNPSDDPGRIMGHLKTVLDAEKDLIYAISPYNHKLQIIGAKDLKLKRELIIGQEPIDLKLYKGKLYIAVSLTSSIVVFDTASQTVAATYELASPADLFAVDGSKVYYQGPLGLRVYDMATAQEKGFTFYSYSLGWERARVDRLIADAENHILYGDGMVGEPGEALYAVSTLDMKPVKLPVAAGKKNNVDYEGMPVFRGKELMYGQIVFDRDSFAQVGEPLRGRILYADDDYIITSHEAYLRKSHTKLGEMPEYYDNMQVDKEKNVCILMKSESYFKKTTVGKLLSNLKNKTPAYEAYVKGELVDEPKPVEKITFNDIGSHWAKEAIEELAQKKIVNGIGKDFAPNNNVTRAEFTAMLIRAIDPEGIEGVKEDMEIGNIFEYFVDVEPKHWYYPSAIVARRIELAMGDGKGYFSPNTPITREQMAVMAMRALERMNPEGILKGEEILSTFEDSGKISSWARQNAASAVRMGIINGKPGMLFAPQDKATRAEAAAVLKRIIDKFE